MKKLVALSALLSLTLVSCGDDDKPQDQNPIIQDPLVGKWNMVKGEVYQNGTLLLEEDLKPGDCNYDFYELKTGGIKDEIYHDEDADCAQGNYTGTWVYNAAAKQVTLVDEEDGYTMVVEVISVTASDLKIKLISEEGEPLPEGIEVFTYLKK